MKYLVILLCSFEILDGIITHWAVTRGLVQEANPLMAHIAGSWDFLLLKIIGALLCALVLFSVHRYFPKMALIGAQGAVTFYWIVLARNFTTLFVGLASSRI
jgi:hypothetical protein